MPVVAATGSAVLSLARTLAALRDAVARPPQESA